jgi:hypothetical protein
MTTTSRDSQIAAFLDRQPYAPVNESPDDPQVIFAGALQLDRQQEENLVLAATRYREQMQEELAGKDDTADLESESVPAQESLDVEGMTWFQERNLWDLVYRQRMGWRRQVWQGIYAAGSNIHFPLTRRTVQQMISRAQNYFFQTEPWFAATPVGMDSEPAKAANDWTQYKFEAAKLRPTLEKAIELAFIRGECVLRVASEDTFSHYEAVESVAVNPETGEPMMWGDESAPEYIFQDDEFAPAEDGSIIHVASGIPFQEPPTEWATVKVKRKIQSYSGPRAQIVAYRDFLAPRTAETLDKADCCCYDYELPAIEIVEQYIARVQRLTLFDGHNTIFTNRFHDFGDQLANFRVTRRNGGDVSNLFFGLHRFSHSIQFFDNFLSRLLDPATYRHWVSSSGNIFHALFHDGLCQNGGCSCAVTGHVVGLRCNFANDLGAHVFKGILELDLFGDRHTVIGDHRATVLLLKHNIAALRPQRCLYGVRQLIDAVFELLTRIFGM